MNGFIKVSNTIFNFGLSPKAIFVYVYLSSRTDSFMSAIVKLTTISKACNMNIKTVCSAIAELEEKKFIRKSNRYNNRGYLTNRYYLKNLLKKNVAWFKLPTEVFKTAIKSTDFLVFCYINKCMSCDKSEAFPSLSVISDCTQISRGRVSQAVQYLRKYTFINRVKRHYKRTKAYRHNRYMKFKMAIRKTCTIKAQVNQTNNYSLTLNKAVVKSFENKNNSLQFSNKGGSAMSFLDSG